MKGPTWRRAASAVLALLILAVGCATRAPAAGALAAVQIRGRVDSRVARDYLAGRPLPIELHRARRAMLEAGHVPSRAELAAVARDYSPDVATLMFVESVASRAENRELRVGYLLELAALRQRGGDSVAVEGVQDITVLFVPGWFYRKHGDVTGADFRRQRELLTRMGVANDLVRTDENGSVVDNARIVAAAIRALTAAGRRSIVVSASKSGAEAALALGRELDADETRSVIAWLSVGGVVRGSPVADRVLEPDLCWLAELRFRREGYDLDGLRSMRTAEQRAAFDTLELPPHLLVVAYIAVPLSSDITRRARFGYARMRHDGPNDGLTLLVDELVPGGLALVEPGVDHFFVGSDIDVRTIALLRILLARTHASATTDGARSAP
jgi:hypothetical protein